MAETVGGWGRGDSCILKCRRICLISARRAVRWWGKRLKISCDLIQAAAFVLFLIRSKIQFTVNKISHFKVHNSGVLSTFTVLCNLHLYQVPNIFITLKGNSVPLRSHSLLAPAHSHCFYGFTCSEYFVWMASYNPGPLSSAFLHLA